MKKLSISAMLFLWCHCICFAQNGVEVLNSIDLAMQNCKDCEIRMQSKSLSTIGKPSDTMSYVIYRAKEFEAFVSRQVIVINDRKRVVMFNLLNKTISTMSDKSQIDQMLGVSAMVDKSFTYTFAQLSGGLKKITAQSKNNKISELQVAYDANNFLSSLLIHVNEWNSSFGKWVKSGTIDTNFQVKQNAKVKETFVVSKYYTINNGKVVPAPNYKSFKLIQQ